MARGIWLVAAGLAVTAAAGGSAAAMQMHSSAAPHAYQAPVAVTRTAQADEIATAARTTGKAAFQSWWVHGGHRQYQRVASDLSTLIIKDVLGDNDDTWIADSQHLVADATAAGRNLPPVDGAAYHSAMVELAQAGRESLHNSFDGAYAYVKAALPKLATFNDVVTARVTAAQINAPV
jgi:hypothetical protein